MTRGSRMFTRLARPALAGEPACTCRRRALTNSPVPLSPTPLTSRTSLLQYGISNRSYSATSSASNKRRPATRLVLLAGLLAGTIYYFTLPSTSQDRLNDTTFVPYSITSREQVSPTSFILTITPHTPDPAPPHLVSSTDSRWRHSLWSVEFKQPQVQISRHYTPLPPRPDDAGADDGQALRFYIRAVGDGEMSNYLSRLRVGQDVWLRGPHVEMDLPARLGDGNKNLVFLAGGTGLAPGMQAASAVLDANDKVRVSLLWAVRRRDELQTANAAAANDALDKNNNMRSTWFGSWATSRRSQQQELGSQVDGPSPVAAQLMQMKARYGDRLHIRVAIDEEQTHLRPQDIRAALTNPYATASFPDPSSSSISSAQSCQLHNQALHQGTSEFEPETPPCRCGSDGSSAAAGKNLLVVSGPDGFVSHYAGPRVWRGGRHTQGSIGGVIADLQRKSPEFAHDWLVLKL